MKKVLVIGAAVCLMSGIVMAQQPPAAPMVHKFNENIQIKSDSDKLMAIVDVDGKVTLTAGSSYDEVINILIVRMIKQNGQALEQIQIMGKLIDDAKARANATTTKAAEIFQIWNPPQTKEEPKKVVEAVKTVKETPTPVGNRGTENSFWQKLTGK